jgi:Phosphodiester glycosidase
MRRSGSAFLRSAALCVLLWLAPLPAGTQPALDLGLPRNVAPGVTLFHLTDHNLLNPAAPVSVWLLKLDLASADLRAALANDEIVDTETIAETAARRQAIAAVNAGFFRLPSGDPAGIYKLNGQLVSDTRRPRGAVGFLRSGESLRLIYGRVAATMSLVLPRRAHQDTRMEIAGVDTTRHRGKLMLFTPAYHSDTDTAKGGLEWVVRGKPLRVTGAPQTAGKTPIPRDGFVLSYGGTDAPPPLSALTRGTRVELETTYTALDRPSDDWARAEAIVGGAGLLIRDGRFIEDWAVEQLTAGFPETRHPRTLIGTHSDGSVWLITVDGRQPKLSAGTSLYELRSLASRLGLTQALNLDGGGSTTMWVQGQIVNSPSDPAGPRKVSDALLVMRR